jgi:hypothetical protein
MVKDKILSVYISENVDTYCFNYKHVGTIELHMGIGWE